MVYGIGRSGGCGVPKCIEQKEAKVYISNYQSRGTIKVAYLNG